MDLPNRGNILQVPMSLDETADGRVGGVAQFRRYHLGRNGAVHGGAIALLFDSLLGYTAFKLSKSLYQRTAFLHVDYRKIVPIEKELQVDAGIDRIEGRKIFVAGRLLDGEDVLCEAHALFVRAEAGPAVSEAERPGIKRVGRAGATGCATGRSPTSSTASPSAWSGWRCSVGIVAIPYPGPGWAIVFLGLAILATEFSAAQRVLNYVRARYDAVMAWFKRQHIAVQAVGTAFTAADRARHAVVARRARLGGRTGRHRMELAEEPYRPGV